MPPLDPKQEVKLAALLKKHAEGCTTRSTIHSSSCAEGHCAEDIENGANGRVQDTGDCEEKTADSDLSAGCGRLGRDSGFCGSRVLLGHGTPRAQAHDHHVSGFEGRRSAAA